MHGQCFPVWIKKKKTSPHAIIAAYPGHPLSCCRPPQLTAPQPFLHSLPHTPLPAPHTPATPSLACAHTAYFPPPHTHTMPQPSTHLRLHTPAIHPHTPAIHSLACAEPSVCIHHGHTPGHGQQQLEGARQWLPGAHICSQHQQTGSTAASKWVGVDIHAGSTHISCVVGAMQPRMILGFSQLVGTCVLVCRC
jgi:hypothetical protein